MKIQQDDGVGGVAIPLCVTFKFDQLTNPHANTTRNRNKSN